jgi:hypothetical protein
MEIKEEDVWAAGKQQQIVNTRSLFCFWAVRELGVSMANLGRRLKLSIPAISKLLSGAKRLLSPRGIN